MAVYKEKQRIIFSLFSLFLMGVISISGCGGNQPNIADQLPQLTGELQPTNDVSANNPAPFDETQSNSFTIGNSLPPDSNGSSANAPVTDLSGKEGIDDKSSAARDENL